MARITVEDCIQNVADRFELVAVSAERAKELQNGSPATVEKEGDKPTVIALREIAEATVSPAALKDNIIASFRSKSAFSDSSESSENLEFIQKEILSDIVNDAATADGLSEVSEEEMKAIA
ncbi:MAG: DNA-directed RNA polymerase subunit omega [Alphaproteobacteria bacterium]|nr:DNA-directed RNA polymerase subunit omega [Alphaproteobacteria bacterium]